ncbi:MAG: hypothetical protein KJ645_03615, partial [Planctomycetes bacterium]|nr:hypothetical protein [Planctomycetota bacterium]
MFQAYPTTRLLVSYLTGLLLGEAAFLFWVLLAVITTKMETALDADQAAKRLIPILMALAGGLMSPGVKPGVFDERPVGFEGRVVEGPWSVNRYASAVHFFIESKEIFIGERIEVVLHENPIIDLAPGDRV